MMTLQQVKNSISKIPPVGCDLKVGGLVTFTNEYGVSFPNNTIIGFDLENEQNEWQKKSGRFVFIVNASNGGAYWFPHRSSELKKQSGWVDDPVCGTKEQKHLWELRRE